MVYINDIPSYIAHSLIYIFADDMPKQCSTESQPPRREGGRGASQLWQHIVRLYVHPHHDPGEPDRHHRPTRLRSAHRIMGTTQVSASALHPAKGRGQQNRLQPLGLRAGCREPPDYHRSHGRHGMPELPYRHRNPGRAQAVDEGSDPCHPDHDGCQQQSTSHHGGHPLQTEQPKDEEGHSPAGVRHAQRNKAIH